MNHNDRLECTCFQNKILYISKSIQNCYEIGINLSNEKQILRICIKQILNIKYKIYFGLISYDYVESIFIVAYLYLMNMNYI